MHSYAYERLSAQDNLFLVTETPETPMHIGAVMVLESGPLRTEDGGIDIDRYKRAIEGILHRIPRYRQKLMPLPLENLPVWVDDPHFNLDFHIRHTSLPKPGSLEHLKKLSSRVMAQALDPSRPLWELWVVEGLDGGDQFAVISKTHHCMIDGKAGADLMTILMSPDANAEIQPADRYIPRPTPSQAELVFDELKRGLRTPGRLLSAVGEVVREVVGDPRKTFDELRAHAAALGEVGRSVTRPCSDTPINGAVGPHRSFDWLTMPLDDVRDVKGVLGCTINDLVLTTVAGGVRRYMEHRRVDPDSLDFRIMAPVSVRREQDRGKLGNQVSSWVVDMPVNEPDAWARLEMVRETTQKLKESGATSGGELMISAIEWLPSSFVGLVAQMGTVPVNMVVTNVPGPQFPLFMLGAPLLGVYPLVPLVAGTGLGVALFSYDGRLCWGFNADPKLVPDLDNFVLQLRDSFEELRVLAVKRSLKPKRRRREPVEAEAEPASAAAAGAPKTSRPKAARRKTKSGNGSGAETADPSAEDLLAALGDHAGSTLN